MASIDYDTEESMTDLQNSCDSSSSDLEDANSESEEDECDSEPIGSSDARQSCKKINK